MFEDEIGREVFQVHRDFWMEVPDARPIALFTAMARRGGLFIWPIKLPGPDGRSNDWNDSQLSAAELAETQWVQIRANMAAGNAAPTVGSVGGTAAMIAVGQNDIPPPPPNVGKVGVNVGATVGVGANVAAGNGAPIEGDLSNLKYFRF